METTTIPGDAIDVCAEPGCISFAAPARMFCSLHENDMRVKQVMEGEKCLKCRTPIRKGDWVRRGSKPMAMTHTKCPPPKKR